MRLLLYNLRYCAGAGREFHLPFPWSGYLKRTTERLAKITDFIRSQAPDIVALVEADAGSFRTRRLNQVEHIAQALGHYHCYQSKYGEDSIAQYVPILNKQVNAFLTSDEIRNEKFHYFDRGVKRLVIELELDGLTVFLVHLSLKFRHRHEQLRDLCAMVKGVSRPAIVAGDFNPFWGDQEVEWFLGMTGLKNANARGWPSYPTRAPKKQTDFILCGPGIRVIRFEIPKVDFSDHLPLVCDFEIEPPGGGG